MAVKDKLVNLEDLKVVGDAVVDLKSHLTVDDALEKKQLFGATQVIDFNGSYSHTILNESSGIIYVLDTAYPVTGGITIQAIGQVVASVKPTAFTSLSLRLIEYKGDTLNRRNDLNNTATTITLLSDTTSLKIGIAAYGSDSERWTEVYKINVLAYSGSFTLASFINAPNYLGKQDVSSSSDANSLLDNTYYSIGFSMAVDHFPFTRGVRALANFKINNYVNHQIAFDYTNGKMAMRRSAGDPRTWTDWRLFDNTNPFNVYNTPSVTLLGDSITQGNGSSDFNANGEDLPTSVYPTKRNTGVKCWGNQIVSLLVNQLGCSAVNNGVDQMDQQDILNNLDVLLPTATDYVILTVGTNARNYTAEIFYTRYVNLLKAIIAKGSTPICFSSIGYNGATAALSAEKIQAITKQACIDCGVTFYPLMSAFEKAMALNGGDRNDYYYDALHPNDAGYALMFEIYRDFLQI